MYFLCISMKYTIQIITCTCQCLFYELQHQIKCDFPTQLRQGMAYDELYYFSYQTVSNQNIIYKYVVSGFCSFFAFIPFLHRNWIITFNIAKKEIFPKNFIKLIVAEATFSLRTSEIDYLPPVLSPTQPRCLQSRFLKSLCSCIASIQDCQKTVWLGI